jgi:hypothetical protein
MHIFDRIAAGSHDVGVKFVAGELRMLQNVRIEIPIVYQSFRPPLNESFNDFTAAGEEANKMVESRERQSRDESPLPESCHHHSSSSARR